MSRRVVGEGEGLAIAVAGCLGLVPGGVEVTDQAEGEGGETAARGEDLGLVAGVARGLLGGGALLELGGGIGRGWIR